MESLMCLEPQKSRCFGELWRTILHGRDLDSETVTITANAGGFAEVNALKFLMPN